MKQKSFESTASALGSESADALPDESEISRRPMVSAEFRRLLEEQRDRFEFSVAASDIGYWFCDLPFDKLTWDSRVKRHFWLSEDTDVDIQLFYKQIHPEDREPTRQAIEASIASRTRYDIEYRTVSQSSEIRWIHAIGRTAYDGSGRPIRFDGVTQDVTALKLTQQAFDAERQRLSAVFQNVPIGLVFAQADGRIVSGNRQAERIFGHPIYSTSDSERNDEWVMLHSDGSRVRKEEFPLTRALKDGGTHSAEYLSLSADGSLKWVEFTGTPILDTEGRIAGGVVAMIDIDVRKRAEQALVQSEKLAVVGRLASTIAHEINNPLEAVVNLIYLIQQSATDPVLQAYAETAQEELARVSHIVTHSLRFNRQTHAPREERLSSLVDSAIAIYEPRITRSGSRLARKYAEDDTALCLPSELRQVFSNLIGNAFDAIKGSGSIHVRTHRVKDEEHGEWVRVTIADSGCGMDTAAKERIFEAFFSTKGDNGTGLGLWVAKEILSRHSGHIRVRSSQTPGNSGTTFCLWFPVRPQITVAGSGRIASARE